MSFLDKLRAERETREQRQLNARQIAKQAAMIKVREEKHLKEAQRNEAEEKKKLYRLAYKYYLQSDCSQFIREIGSHLAAKHSYQILSTYEPREYIRTEWYMPIPTSVRVEIRWPIRGVSASVDEAAHLAESVEKSLYRGSQFTSAQEFAEHIRFEHADYYSVEYSEFIVVIMEPDGKLTIQGKQTTALEFERWKREKRLIDDGFEMAMRLPGTEASIMPGYHPSNKDLSMGLSD